MLILYLARLLSLLFSYRVLVIDLEPDGKLAALRKKLSDGFLSEKQDLLDYSIVYNRVDHLFHLIPSYTKHYDLIFISIPSAQNLQKMADVFILSEICIVCLVPEQKLEPETSLFLKNFEQIRILKDTKALPFHYFGVLNLLDSSHEIALNINSTASDFPFLKNSLKTEHTILQSLNENAADNETLMRYTALGLEFHELVINPFLSFQDQPPS